MYLNNLNFGVTSVGTWRRPGVALAFLYWKNVCFLLILYHRLYAKAVWLIGTVYAIYTFSPSNLLTSWFFSQTDKKRHDLGPLSHRFY